MIQFAALYVQKAASAAEYNEVRAAVSAVRAKVDFYRKEVKEAERLLKHAEEKAAAPSPAPGRP